MEDLNTLASSGTRDAHCGEERKPVSVDCIGITSSGSPFASDHSLVLYLEYGTGPTNRNALDTGARSNSSPPAALFGADADSTPGGGSSSVVLHRSGGEALSIRREKSVAAADAGIMIFAQGFSSLLAEDRGFPPGERATGVPLAYFPPLPCRKLAPSATAPTHRSPHEPSYGSPSASYALLSCSSDSPSLHSNSAEASSSIIDPLTILIASAEKRTTTRFYVFNLLSLDNRSDSTSYVPPPRSKPSAFNDTDESIHSWLTCFRGHDLKGLLSATWSCDCCNDRSEDGSEEVYGCAPCNFYVCPACFRALTGES
jgi:hypothetical protein